jgi:hypothetical protein
MEVFLVSMMGFNCGFVPSITCIANGIVVAIKNYISFAWLQLGGFMLWTISIVLIILWVLGLVSSYTLSGYIHVLLVVAVVLVLIRIIQGRRVL